MLWVVILSSVFSILLLSHLLFSILRIRKLKNFITQLELQLLQTIENSDHINTELLSTKQSVIQNSLQDPLTGLANRHVFEDRVEQTLKQSQRYKLTFAVMFLDLDGFKIINEALGREIGDQLIKEAAERLKNAIRQVDTIAHFSGNEFVFLLPQLSKPETAAYVAQRLLDVIAQPFNFDDQEIYITASIGIATFPADSDETQSLLKNAGNAMHQVKAGGRSSFQFYREDMQVLSRRELALNSSLRSSSIYRDFTLYYTPQINVETNKIIAVDVVLNWQHPDFGLISLQEFYRLADNSGKTVAIGEWMLRSALQQLKKWKSQNVYFDQIIVTVSLRQLENPNFAYKVAQILQEEKLDPACLILKISETMLLKKLEAVEKGLRMLKHLGIQIAIDEFGAGHLALQHIRSFSVDYLKVDRSLIQDITNNQESEAIIKMIMTLATSLQVTVVADGVDTINQKELLMGLGCKIMQGNLFGSAPRSADEVVNEAIA